MTTDVRPAKCGCDPAIADHRILDTKGHGLSCDTVTRTWECIACRAEWTDEPTILEMQRELESEGLFV